MVVATGISIVASRGGSSSSVPSDAEASETPGSRNPEISGFAYPVQGGCLPEDDNLMPGALREYRQGIHEGIDFYSSDNCAAIGFGTEVIAAKAGTVIRADWIYDELNEEALAELMQRVEEVGGDDSGVLDVFRGRQVSIDHGDGTVTRYVHLSGIAEGIDVGTKVEQGQVIAYVGESGTPTSVTDPGTEAHGHFEIRIGSTYLGQELADPEQVRRLYQQAFSP